MKDEVASSIALFFYLALMDEVRAKAASAQAISIFNSQKDKMQKSLEKSPKNTPSQERHDSICLVLATKKVIDEMAGRFVRGRPNLSTHAGWIVPTGLDLGPWREFQKNASFDELLVVIWAQVLNLSHDDIALGWGSSSGTVHYRLSKALRKLGSMVPQNKPAKLGLVT